MEPLAMTDTGYKAAIAQIFAELQLLDVSILQHQAETEKLRNETRLILIELKQHHTSGQSHLNLETSFRT